MRFCRERIGREGWVLAQTYSDRALSGASLLRPGLQGLVEDAMDARFEVLIAEGEIRELHVGLKGTMNQLFLKDLADKTRRGLRGRVEAGQSGGGRCFGYDVVRWLGRRRDGQHRRA